MITDISAVVAQCADDRQQAAPDELLARERDVLVVDMLRELREAVGEIAAEVEELQLLGGFLAAAHLAQVVHLALGRGLAEVFGVAEEGEVGFTEERRQHAKASSSSSQGE